jgi:hypothetical protein
LWLNFKVVYRNLPGRTEENHRKISVRIACLRVDEDGEGGEEDEETE